MESTKTPHYADDPIHPDDAYAGKILGWILSVFFAYTIVTSIYVAWWTWKSISG